MKNTNKKATNQTKPAQTTLQQQQPITSNAFSNIKTKSLLI